MSFQSDIIPLIERFASLPYKSERIFTIDRSLQKMCIDIMKDRMTLQKTYNGAVIVVDNDTMEIKAYVGSPFFESSYPGVKYNACNIRRSPGSTLKPFIYGKALETGIITPKLKIPDIPKDFSGYKPKNFSNNYYGVISCDEALYRSLNIPAIQIESKLGNNGVRSVLRNTGMTSFFDMPDKNDLSIVLGSFPLTLEDLTSFYTALAHNGNFSRPVFFKEEKPASEKSIMSPEASYVISEILALSYRPDLNASWEYAADKPKVAYKTGTSYGYVDAWAIGYTPKYTIGVWMGNLDNKFSRIMTGIGDASPVLFRIMDELCRYDDRWFTKPDGVSKRKVCAVSGMVPGKFCENLIDEYYIKNVSSGQTCNVHRRIVIDGKTGMIVPLSEIKSSGIYKERIIEVWPDEIEYFFNKYGKKNTDIQGNYSDLAPDNPLRIISPAPDITYMIESVETKYEKIPLDAYGYPDSNNFYWYANDKFLGKIKCGEPFYFLPDEKEIEISVIDEMGRVGSVKIKVGFKK